MFKFCLGELAPKKASATKRLGPSQLDLPLTDFNDLEMERDPKYVHNTRRTPPEAPQATQNQPKKVNTDVFTSSHQYNKKDISVHQLGMLPILSQISLLSRDLPPTRVHTVKLY